MTEPQTPKNMVGIILRTGFGQDEWDLTLPLNVVVQALISRMTKEASLGLSALDSDGNRIPYRLMWQEGERYLAESETLGEAGVKDSHTLIITQEARAGNRNSGEIMLHSESIT